MVIFSFRRSLIYCTSIDTHPFFVDIIDTRLGNMSLNLLGVLWYFTTKMHRCYENIVKELLLIMVLEDKSI